MDTQTDGDVQYIWLADKASCEADRARDCKHNGSAWENHDEQGRIKAGKGFWLFYLVPQTSWPPAGQMVGTDDSFQAQ